MYISYLLIFSHIAKFNLIYSKPFSWTNSFKLPIRRRMILRFVAIKILSIETFIKFVNVFVCIRVRGDVI